MLDWFDDHGYSHRLEPLRDVIPHVLYVDLHQTVTEGSD